MRARMLSVLALATLGACGGGGGGGGSGGGSAPAQAVQAAPETPKTPEVAPETVAVQASAPAPCSVAYWGDSIAGLTAPRLDKRLQLATHGVIGGTAMAALPSFLQEPMPERFVVIEYGTNDSNGGSDLGMPLRSMLERVKAMGRTPVLVGLSNATVGQLAVHANYNMLTQALAHEFGAIYADWPSVQYGGPGDLWADGVHPGDAYQQRLADKLSQAILAAAPECN